MAEELLSDYFNIEELQEIQDLFSEATRVISVILAPDGTPITKMSGSCRLCEAVQNTELGAKHCANLRNVIGKPNPKGPNVMRCSGTGLLHAAASIMVDDKHLANWLVGPVLDASQPFPETRKYARAVGVDDRTIERTMSETNGLTFSQFESVSKYLYKNAQVLSGYAKKNKELEAEKEALRASESRLRRAQEIAHIGNWELDLSGAEIWASDEARRIYGVDKASNYFSLDYVRNLILAEDLPLRERSLAGLIHNNEPYDVDFRITRPKDGQERILNSQALLEYDLAGKPLRVSGIIQDITEKKKAELILQESEERFRAIFFQSPFGIALVDSLSHHIYQANQRFLDILGRSAEEISVTDWKSITHPDDLENDMQLWEAVQEGSRASYRINKRYLLPDGEYVWTTLTLSRVEMGNSTQKMHILMLEDITQSKLAEEQIFYFSYHDQLTGLYNRRFFEEEIKNLDKPEHLPLSVLIGDINGFKLFNDAFGHEQGDQLMISVATIIRTSCRPGDILFRWGGDEFLILLPGTDVKEAAALANRIREHCAKQTFHDVAINISFGWDVKKRPYQTIGEVMKKAEDQMYKNKIVESQGLRGSIIKTVIHTLHAKNPREENHSQRVSTISEYMGKALKLPDIEVRKLKAVGLLHDIGKIGIEDSILDKVDTLTKEEYAEIKKHPEIGYRILNASADMAEFAEITLSHHERWDGRGYPKGLRGEEIPLLSRIVSIADSYDAMTSDRPYRKALTKEEAAREISANAGSQFDNQLAHLFLEKVFPAI